MRYEGCYRDGFRSDFERMIPMKRELLGVKSCTNQCHLKGYPYAAIQNAQFCMCSQKYGRYGLADDESECRRECVAGSPDEKCGGPWKNAVYRIGTFCATFFSNFRLYSHTSLTLPNNTWNQLPAETVISFPTNR